MFAQIGSHRNTSIITSAESVPTATPETVVQQMVDNPFVTAVGHKAELRLFVAITCLEVRWSHSGLPHRMESDCGWCRQPLTVWLHRDFCLRVASSKYNGNLAASRRDAAVHQITSTDDISAMDSKMTRDEFREYVVSKGHSFEKVMGR